MLFKRRILWIHYGALLYGLSEQLRRMHNLWHGSG
jgi:hypothetical protein